MPGAAALTSAPTPLVKVGSDAKLEYVVGAAHITGEYDYQLTLGCRDTAALETAVDRLKESHGVGDVVRRRLRRRRDQ